ncbi:MAG: phage head-tail joining protein [Pseudomonadota bacterium]
MIAIEELKSRREALAASRASGVARASYDGKTVEYRSVAEIDRAIEALDREIAAACAAGVPVWGRSTLEPASSAITLTSAKARGGLLSAQAKFR